MSTTASIDCIRYLLHQGLAFRGRDEYEESMNKGNFLSLLEFLANHNEEIKKVVLKNAPENLKLTSPKIQKDIVSAIAVETTNVILGEVSDGLFSILVDKSRDISVKEQMAVRDILREKQFEKVIEGIANGEILTGRGLKQEVTLKCAGDTCWGSHYGTLMSLICLFYSVIGVLLVVGEQGSLKQQRAQAYNLLELTQSYEFAFHLHLMQAILGITNDLSQALQRKDQDIVNAINLVKITKKQLQTMRGDGWQELLNEVSLFCIKHKIGIINMEDNYVVHGRSRRNVEDNTNLHHYRVKVFYAVIDSQILELNNRFNEVNNELLLCMACLDPSNSFTAYDKSKLLRFAEFYPSEFPPLELMALGHQFDNYILDVRFNTQFSEVVGLTGLVKKLVQLKKHGAYPLVYLLVKLALLLPVATATAERVFSTIKFIKTSLCIRLGDVFMNDCLVTYIERDLFVNIDNEDVIQSFQNMKNRRGVL